MAHFPNVSNPEYFRQAFRPCASQRLFYPVCYLTPKYIILFIQFFQLILPEYDSVIHIDSDAILLSPVEQLWDYFDRMNSSQILGMAPDNTNPLTSYYKVGYKLYRGVEKIPTPTEYSLNSGVILMNLTRMRQVKFFDQLEPIVKQYNDSIKWFVNDFLTIYLGLNPDRYLNVSCRWNYVTDHCSTGQLCRSADKLGVALLHGSRQTFLIEDIEPAFHIVYSVFRNYKLNSDLTENLINPLKSELIKAKNTKCGRISYTFISPIYNYVNNQPLNVLNI